MNISKKTKFMDPCFGIVETIDAFYQKLKTGNNAQGHFICSKFDNI